MTGNGAFPGTEVVDVSALFDSAREDRPAVDAGIADRLERHGSLVATGFEGADTFDDSARRLLEFFAMDEKAKLSCAVNGYCPEHPNIYRGFYPMPKEAHWSRKEIFDIGPEPAMSSPDVPGARSLRESNAWPVQEPAPGWQAEMTGTLCMLRRVAVTLLAAAARGLGVEEQGPMAAARGRNATLRLLHYRPAPPGPDAPSSSETADDGRKIIAGSHIDTGLLSLLWQDKAGGLQLQGPDGIWRDAPLVANSLSVHCGDLVGPLTGGRLAGTRHRAVGGDRERCSIGFFLEPDFTTIVVPPSGDEPVSYAGHLVNEFPGRFEPTEDMRPAP